VGRDPGQGHGLGRSAQDASPGRLVELLVLILELLVLVLELLVLVLELLVLVLELLVVTATVAARAGSLSAAGSRTLSALP
jgi:hypothetical protein